MSKEEGERTVTRQDLYRAIDTADEEDLSLVQDLIDAATNGEIARIRVEAALVYMSDPDQCSIEELHKDKRFSKYPLRQLQQWCKDDKWVDRRRQWTGAWSKNAYRALVSAVSEERKTALSMMAAVRDRLVERILDHDAEIKSIDSAAQALTKVIDSIDKMQQSITDQARAATEARSETKVGILHDDEKKQLVDEAIDHVIAKRRLAIVAGTDKKGEEK